MRKMKDSGIEWIGEIPEGWEIIPVKYLAKYNYDTLAESCSPDFEFSYIDIGSVTYTDGITNYQNFKFKDAPSRARRIVHSGDILVSTVRTYLRAVACVNEHRLPQIASTGFLVLQADISKIHPHFLMYSVLSDNFICKVEANSVGISYPAINASQIVHFKLPIPQLSEQFLLVTYLDRQCSEIDALLSKTLSSIEEYKKLKQAVITQAVTKGVRGEREMKPTDFTRWSEIPFDWNLKRVKSCIASISSGLSAVTDDANSEESGKFVLRTSAVSSGFFVPTEVKPVLKSAVNRLICPVEPDTLIVSRMNTASMVGACAYVANNHPNTFLPDKLWKIKFLPSYHTKYMWYALNSVPAKSWFSELATGASSSMQNISINDFTSNYLPIPAFSEQEEIADYLDAKCAEIDKLIAKKEQLVKELESYKKSLIYEVVTGKREV